KQLERFLKVLERGVFLGAISHAGDDAADLVDHFGLIRAVSRARLRVSWLELQHRRERVLDLSAKSLRKRFRHGNPLSVAAQRIRVEVMRIGVLRRIVATLVGPGGGLLEKRELRLVALLQIIRIDRLRLDGRIDTRTTGGASRLDGALEIAGMIMTPRVDDGGLLPILLAIP